MLFKVVLLGEVAVGKTTLRRSYMGKVLVKNYVKTLGFDFAIKKHDSGTLQIWDIAGEMDLNSVSSFIRGSSGVVLLFDLSNSISLEKTYQWIDIVFDQLGSDTHIAFVGNKLDLVGDIEIIEQNAIQSIIDYMRNLADNSRIEYFETSALTSIGVDKIFDWLVPAMVGDSNN